jgi:hypothetical protein
VPAVVVRHQTTCDQQVPTISRLSPPFTALFSAWLLAHASMHQYSHITNIGGVTAPGNRCASFVSVTRVRTVAHLSGQPSSCGVRYRSLTNPYTATWDCSFCACDRLFCPWLPPPTPCSSVDDLCIRAGVNPHKIYRSLCRVSTWLLRARDSGSTWSA